MNRENLAPQVEAQALLFKRYSMLDQPNDYCYYALTLKCNLLNQITYHTDIRDMIKKKFGKWIIHTQVWELDSKNNLHCHCLASYKKDCKYKNFRQYGWNLHVEPLLDQTSKFKWENYLEKERENDILLRHTSLYQNLFE